MSQSAKQDMERVGPLWGVLAAIVLGILVWVFAAIGFWHVVLDVAHHTVQRSAP